jgi:hypothetical protein
MKKRIAAIFISLAVIITAVPVQVSAATAPEDKKPVCYTAASDYKSGDCILSATKVMIRRAMVMRGSTKWSTITNKTIRKKATIFGLLLHRFTFEADGMSFKIRVGFFKGNTNAARIREFERLIKAHPEGVVIWGKNASVFGMHGVLLTDVKNGVPYVMDSWYNLGPRKCGIQVWDDSSMKNPLRCTQYWIIKEVGLAKKAQAPAKGKPLAPISAKDVDTKSTLSIKDQSIPVKIKEGNSFGVEGVISSNYRISSVTVKILDSNGDAVISKTVKPGKWNYDLAGVDSSIKFGKLSTGTYTYRITAKDEVKSKTLTDADFTVVPKPATGKSKLVISKSVYPSVLYKGEGFSIGGKITSNYKIKKVTVSVTDESGNKMLSATAKPSAKKYEVGGLDAKIKFGTLSAGKYTYSVVATDTKQTRTLVDRSFEVINKPVYSTLKIESYNYPSSLAEGKSFSIKGSISSNKKIETVTVQVVDGDGNAVLYASAKPDAKSFQVKDLDAKIRFGTLDKGTYKYQVIAKDTVKTKKLVNRSFTVN